MRRATAVRLWVGTFLVLLLAILVGGAPAFSQPPREEQRSEAVGVVRSGLNAIETENALTGTTSWKRSDPATAREIEGYASLTSVNKGSAIDLFVSTSSPTFTYQVYRMGWYAGAGGRSVLGSTSAIGGVQAMPSIHPDFGTIDCNWNTSFSISGATLRAFFELRAGGYDGSTYDLTYDPVRDRLKGTYYQAVAKQKFDVYYAMKAIDPTRAFGSVIGKAMRPLADGHGMIPVLVALR